MVKNSICCVIVTYNIGVKFCECFNSIYNQVEQIIIIDNGSSEETIEVLKSLEKTTTAKVIYNGENLGIALALNIGVKFAEENKFSWVLTMDNDSIATAYMVEAMLTNYTALGENERSSVVSLFPTCIETGYASEKDKEKQSKPEIIGYNYVDFEITSGNLVKTEVINKAGYFDEKLFIDMVDYDFCFKLVQLGYKHIKVSNSILLHSLGQATKRNLFFRTVTYTNHNSLRKYYITRNRFYVWNKYKDIVPDVIKADKSAFKKEIIKIILFEQDKFNKIKMIIKGYKHFKNNEFGALKQ